MIHNISGYWYNFIQVRTEEEANEDDGAQMKFQMNTIF